MIKNMRYLPTLMIAKDPLTLFATTPKFNLETTWEIVKLSHCGVSAHPINIITTTHLFQEKHSNNCL